MATLIRGSQYWVDPEDIEDLEAFKEHFTYKPKFDNLEPICTATFDKKTGLWGFPRNTVLNKDDVVEDKTTEGSKLNTDLTFLGEMWDYQDPAILDFVSYIQKGKNDLILRADTGAGKTVMLLKMWTILKVPALVIVPKSDLMEQWEDRIQKFVELEADQIGKARQNICDYKGKPIVVGMLHSLCKDKYSKNFKNHFGLIIFDELHKLGAETFSRVGGMFPARYRLGATATLRRADGMSKVFYSHLGKEVIKVKKGDNPDPKIITVRYGRTSGKIPHWCKSKVQRRGSLFSLLASNVERTDWIAYYANEIYKTDRQTLVLGERIAQLQMIIQYLIKKYNVPKEDVGLYIGKTSPKERERIAKDCKIIVATTSMLALGTDIPTLRGLVFATPLADAEQAIGRICRFSLGSKDPVVIDFVDATYKESLNWFRARKKLYERKEWELQYANG